MRRFLSRRSTAAALAVMAAVLATGAPAARASGQAPGAPGVRTTWANADKDAFGTAFGGSPVWFTHERGSLTEVFYPTIDRPDVRWLQLAVGDGRSWAVTERGGMRHRVRLTDGHALAYRVTSTDRRHRFRIVEDYVTDPMRATLLVHVRFRSLTGRPLRLYALYDPSLANSEMGDTGWTAGSALLARDGGVTSALRASMPFGRTSTGFVGRSDGLRDLADGRMNWSFRRAGPGNVMQTAELGRRPVRTADFTLALGFGPSAQSALTAADGSLSRGWRAAATAYAAGWHGYLGSLSAPPSSVRGNASLRREYDVSVMVVRAHEDKRHPGAFVASPSVPWTWESPSLTDTPRGDTAVYHMVWARDLYQMGTALLAAGDRAGATAAVRWLFARQQLPDGHFPQNSWVDGRQFWTATQMDQASFPTVLAWQLGPAVARSEWAGIRRAAEFVAANGPATDSDRWENAAGYSPATIAAEIAGLVCAADVARSTGHAGDARRWLATADDWAAHVDSWTYTTTGPLGSGRYYLRIDGNTDPDDGAGIALSDGGGTWDERRIVDPSFLELVRLGIKRPDDPHILSTLPVIDRLLEVHTPNGPYWHRYDHDGYGEFPDGRPWDLAGKGRAWPLLSGERGEYELAAGHPARAVALLTTLARAGGSSMLLPEQVWDVRGDPTKWRFRLGEGTLSATPLAWPHAQFIRLAWGIAHGSPVETPSVVACRYVRACS
jgi:glucoamylase